MHDKLVIGYPVLEGFIWCSCQRSRFASDYPSKLKSHIWETNWPILFIQHLLNQNPNPNVYTKFPIYIIYSFHTHLILIHCKQTTTDVDSPKGVHYLTFIIFIIFFHFFDLFLLKMKVGFSFNSNDFFIRWNSIRAYGKNITCVEIPVLWAVPWCRRFVVY